MKQYVIIGNGVAATGCVEGIRSADPEGKITVISGENRPVYCRPLISYYLEGKATPEKMNYRSEGFAEKMNCEFIYGKQAVQLRQDDKTVVLDDGTVLPYDEVCIATGSVPFAPPFAGLDTVEKQFSFMTMDDALALDAAVNKDSRVLIVGAGLIGLKCAEGLHGRVASITVCDLADRVLSSILDTRSAAVMQQHLEENGIHLLLGDTVSRFEKNVASMRSGAEVEFDVLVLAVGVKANTALARQAGAEVNRGILVNEKMETTVPGIFAAGDCTEGMDASLGQRRVLAILPNAYLQGRCAGINMAGGSAVHDRAIPMNSLGLLGLHAMTAGTAFSEADGGSMVEEKSEAGWKRFFVKDGYLTGFMLLGDVDRAGIYTALIREKTPLDSIDFAALKKSPTLAAMPKENRRKKLGGVV